MEVIEVFGLPLTEIIFSLFLPFLFFYLLLYALLKKSKVLGESKEANRLNIMMSVVISALGIFSLYYLGFSTLLPYLAAFLAVAAFFVIFAYGIFGFGTKKISSYYSGEAFKTEEEKIFDAGVKNCENIWAMLKVEKNPAIQQKLLKEMAAEITKLESSAPKLGKSLYDFEWYQQFKQVGG